jgi:hypothetical protein
MRPFLVTLVLASFVVPLATAHVVICQGPDPSRPCVESSIGQPARPPHTVVNLDYCVCSHDGPSPVVRVLP